MKTFIVIFTLCIASAFAQDNQARPDTVGTITFQARRDTTAVTLFVGTDSVSISENSYFKFPAKVLIIIDGYMVRDTWHAWPAIYLDSEKRVITDPVYFTATRKETP